MSGYTQPPAANVSARGGTLPPGLVSQQDVLSASGVFSPSALPFVSAPPPSDPMPLSQMSFHPAPTTERMGANAAQPPPPAAPPGFASPGFGAAGPPVQEAARTPMPSLHAGVPAPAGPPSAAAPASAPAVGAAPGAAVPGAPPAGGGWDGAAMPPAESPWATTSARLEMPALPSSFVQERAEPQKPPAAPVPRREGGRALIVALSVILAIALLALVGITLWQSMGGGGPIAIDYTEPPPTTAETSPAPTQSVSAAPSAPAAPRPVARPRPKNDDIYEEVEKEKTAR
ncbi:hypothetical protein [Sorangium sp. So ce590]|uniref:hypothetical protein n=1 Tax=unclassified Sorangium TaxID=2621164 RepID=UPI003F628EC0